MAFFLGAPNPTRDTLPDAHVTQAPSAHALELQLRGFATLQRRVTVPPCATSCIASAVTNLTPCETSDYNCQCQLGNELAIEEGAADCVIAACGTFTANGTLHTTRPLLTLKCR
jgi:hypothetical protein